MNAPLLRRTFVQWLVLFATPLLWGAHFGLVYAVASLEITLRGVAGWPTQVATLVLTAIVLGAIALLGWATYTGRMPGWGHARVDPAALWRRCGLYLAVVSFFGVLWQGLPALVVPGAPQSHHAAGGGVNVPSAQYDLAERS